MRRSASMLIALLLLLSVSAFANVVVSVPSGTGGWYQGVTATDATGAFWDNVSSDSNNTGGGGCNVGYWLQASSWPVSGCNKTSGQPTFAGTPPGQPLDYFAAGAGGTGIGTTAVGWLFQPSAPNQFITLDVEVAGNHNGNIFGWYTANSDGSVNGNLNVLFNGAANPGATRTITTNSNFGFFMCAGASAAVVNGACTSGNLFLSGSAYTSNTATPNAGKFALFSQVPANPSATGAGTNITTYWIGAEDTSSGGFEGIGDYNDMIFKATIVPEPGFYGLMALGLSGLALAIRRRKAQA